MKEGNFLSGTVDHILSYVHAVMAGACTRAVAISLVGILLQLTGLVLFVLGFFPVKPALTGIRYVLLKMVLD